MAVSPIAPEQNRLLAALPDSAKERIFPRLTLIELDLGAVIYESGQPIEYVYFPTNCIISLLYVMLNGASAEISVVGNEGMAGIAVFMGETAPPAVPLCKAGGPHTGCPRRN